MIKLLKEKIRIAESIYDQMDYKKDPNLLQGSYYAWGRLQAFKEALKLIEG